MKHSGVFTARMNREGDVRIPHGLGTVPSSWTYWPDSASPGRFNLGHSTATAEHLVIRIEGCGPFRRWFPIEWLAETPR